MSSQKQPAPKLGVTDFLQFVYDTQPEWALLAVKAPVEQVADAFAALNSERWLHDVPCKPAAEADDMGSSLVVVAQIKDNPWTVILREICYVTEEGMGAVVEEAKVLSATLKTRAITFVGEDTSGALEYQLFEVGKLLERAQWESGGPFYIFKSTLRKRPPLEEVDDDFADEVFRSHGVYLPACYPQSEGDQAWVCVEKASAPVIERADVIDLGEEDEKEEEEEEDEEEEDEEE